MGYKIPDLKEDIKEEIENWLQTYGQVQIGEECIEPIHDIIDEQFEKILHK